MKIDNALATADRDNGMRGLCKPFANEASYVTIFVDEFEAKGA
jgi:hypothetical protein